MKKKKITIKNIIGDYGLCWQERKKEKKKKKKVETWQVINKMCERVNGR